MYSDIGLEKISTVETDILDLKLRSDFKASTEKMSQFQERAIVKIVTESGLTGIGEGAPLTFFGGETPQTIKAVIDKVLGKVVIGKDPLTRTDLISELQNTIPNNQAAKCALESALWDLVGKMLGLPVCHLLGRNSLSYINNAYVIGLKDTDELKDDINQIISQGYQTLKVKLTGDLDIDMDILKTTRETAGKDITIRADANGAYTLTQAVKAVSLFLDFNLEYLEQPICKNDLDGLYEVRKMSKIPIAADESLQSPQDALKLITKRAADHFIIKLSKVGGISNAIEIVNMAKQCNIGITLVSPLESSLGIAAGLHLGFSIPNASSFDHELNTLPYLEHDLGEGIIADKNKLYLAGTGLGVTFSQIK